MEQRSSRGLRYGWNQVLRWGCQASITPHLLALLSSEWASLPGSPSLPGGPQQLRQKRALCLPSIPTKSQDGVSLVRVMCPPLNQLCVHLWTNYVSWVPWHRRLAVSTFVHVVPAPWNAPCFTFRSASPNNQNRVQPTPHGCLPHLIPLSASRSPALSPHCIVLECLGMYRVVILDLCADFHFAPSPQSCFSLPFLSHPEER